MITASAFASSSPSTRIPSASTGIGTNVSPAPSTEFRTSSWQGSSTATRLAPPDTRARHTSERPWQ
jgi:hypothetical protein